MELRLTRNQFSDKSTIGILTCDGSFEAFTLEDRCREAVPGSWTADLKVKGATAIPYGRYEVVVTFSNRFKKPLPLLLNVPDFAGVRIHPGNTAADTEGCILVGQGRGKDIVTNSKVAFQVLMLKIEDALRTEKVFLEIVT